MTQIHTLTGRLRQLVDIYIECLEMYCLAIKNPNKNPATILVITRRLIAVNQELQNLAKQIQKLKQDY